MSRSQCRWLTPYVHRIGLLSPSCLRNVISMFHVIEKEFQWRQKQGLSEGFETLKQFRPIVAVGAAGPLEDQRMMADFFRR